MNGQETANAAYHKILDLIGDEDSDWEELREMARDLVGWMRLGGEFPACFSDREQAILTCKMLAKKP